MGEHLYNKTNGSSTDRKPFLPNLKMGKTTTDTSKSTYSNEWQIPPLITRDIKIKTTVQGNTTSHPPEWLNFKMLTAPDFVDYVEM